MNMGLSRVAIKFVGIKKLLPIVTATQVSL